MYRRIATIIGLEVYALALAFMQLSIGVRTDEAKYLLDIPYPHPPAVRFIFSLLDGWQYQELFWRIVCATVVIQSVWLVIACVKHSSRLVSIAAALSWLLASAVVIQSGTVMMAPLTAVQGLVFVWLALRQSESRGYAGIIALFWLFSLFTAYQAGLFLPLVWMALGRTGTPFIRRVLLIGMPIVLLGLYTLTNPLAAASMVSHVGKGADPLLVDRLMSFLRLYAIGGGIIGSIAGTIGLLLRPRFGTLMSLVLVSAYILFSSADYYAILFTPLFAAGVILLLQTGRSMALPVTCLMPVGLALSFLFVAWPPQSHVPEVMAAIDDVSDGDVLLINGSFGHEWQFTSSTPVLRYDVSRLDTARAVICLEVCPDMQMQPQWLQLQDLPVEVWVRR
jgi:hypothetical protein